MRQLTKIIFIDSADIEHGVVKLDNNIHIMGDQGAGKTTTQRAILFFYTADKKRLGIETDSDKKGFVEFYLPRKTSCIIYEVTRENGTFSILTYQKDNRQVWRIIDCPFENRFLLKDDSILLKPSEEWDQIAVNIGAKIYKSEEIKTAKDYLNIIYGNLNAFTNKEKQSWRRFSLVESNNFQNIVRILEKIFLDSNKLEAGEIKQTLIDTILNGTDKKPEINLQQYADSITILTKKYEDILKWFKKNDGMTSVEDQAQQVTDTYHDLMESEEKLKELCKKLAAAIRCDQRRLPKLRKEIEVLAALLDEKRKNLHNLQNDHNSQRDSLKGQLAVLNDFIEKAENLKKKYDDEDFLNILEKVANKKNLEIERNSLINQISALLDKSKTLAEKYDAAINALKNEIAELTNTANAEKNRVDEILLTDIQEIQKSTDKTIKEIEEQRDKDIEDVQNLLDQLNKKHTNYLVAIKDVELTNPYKEEMDKLQDDLRKKEDELQQSNLEENEINLQIERIRNENNNNIEAVKREADTTISNLKREIKTRQEEIARLEDLLSQQSGSFIEWLDENVEGWENNIGKVVDEKNILYRQDLNPELTTQNGNSFYGVQIQLNNIEKEILTPQAIKEKINKLKNEIYNTDKEIRVIQQETDDKVAKLSQKADRKLNPLKKELKKIEGIILTLPPVIKRIKTEWKNLNEQLKTWRADQAESIRKEDDILSLQIKETKDKRDKIKEDTRKEVAKHRKALTQKEIDLRQNAGKEKQNIDARLKDRTDEIEKNIALQQQQKQMVLTNEGVDTASLKKLEDEQAELNSALQEIEILMPKVNVYHDKKKEYIDHIEEKKNERTKVNAEIDDLENKFSSEYKKVNDEITLTEQKLNDKNTTKTTIENNLTDAKTKAAIWGIDLVFDDNNIDDTDEHVNDIIQQMDEIEQKRRDNTSLLRNQVTTFSNNFGADNQFKFKTSFSCEEDYMTAAKDLATFVEENRIENFKIRINTYCESFISDIRKEVTNILQFDSEIAGIVNKINKDIENENFVSSINSIMIKKTESADPIVQQLINIQSFYEEFQEHLHQMDLFSNPEDNRKSQLRAMELLVQLKELIVKNFRRTSITVEDTFRLEVRVVENGHDSGWREIVKNPGSNGTSLLVMTIINITLLNVYKEKLSKRSAKYTDLHIHCLLDEGGRLYEKNIQGLVEFANRRNIFLILVTPNAIDDVKSYKHHYLLFKEHSGNKNITRIIDLLNTQ